MRTVVRSIAYEGVEEMTPLVYFEGQGRPLALNFDQRGDFARIGRSTLVVDWVGLAVVLRPEKVEGGETIRIYAIEEQPRATAKTVPAQQAGGGRRTTRTIVRLLLILVIVALAISAIAAVENTSNLFSFFGLR